MIPSRPTTAAHARPWIEPIALALVALLVHWAGNGQISLWDRDEPRYAGCAREMIAAGTWIAPTFNGEPFYHKPVLTYWLMRGGYALAGDNPFGARLASGVAGALLIVATWSWGRRMFGPAAGRWAALALLVAPLMVVEAKLATTDAPLALQIVVAMWALWELSRRASWGWALTFWACLALSVLTKGPVGPAVIGVSAVASWLFGGPRSYLARLKWIPGIMLALAIAGPWFAAIELASQGEFHRILIGDQVLRRAATTIESHPGVPCYYLGVTALGFFPASVLLPMALAFAWRARKTSSDLGFLLGWALGPLLMFEVAQTKLLHYYYPSYPALALLVGRWIAGMASGELPALGRSGRIGLTAGFGILGGAGTIGLILGIFTPVAALRAPCLVGAIVAGTGLVSAWRPLALGRVDRAWLRLSAAWGLLALLSGAWLLPAAESGRITVEVGRKLRAQADRGGESPALIGFKPPGLIYLMGRSLPVLSGPKGLAAQVNARGGILVALRPDEATRLQDGWPDLDLTIVETVRGFDIERFRNETILIARVHATKTGGGGQETGPARVAAAFRGD